LSSSKDDHGFFIVTHRTEKNMTFLTKEEAFLKHAAQSEPASMTAPFGRSIHRMGYVFHPPLHPYINQHSTIVNFFAC